MQVNGIVMSGGAKMNQEMIGKFIAECRKEKHLTQNQLQKNLALQIVQFQNGKQGKAYQMYL